MSVLRLLLGVLIIAFFYLLGQIKIERGTKRLKLFSDIISDLKETERLIRLERKPISLITERLSESGAAREFWLEVRSGNDIGRILKVQESGFYKELSELLANGAISDSFLEASRIRDSVSLLERCYEAENAKTQARSRLIGVLSVLLGVSIALLIM